MNVGIDFRKELLDMDKDFAVNIIYQRSSKMIKCTCYNELYRSGKADCEICRGTGKLIGFQRYKVINHIIQDTKVRNHDKETDLGDVVAPISQFYFHHDDNPQARDIIILTGWNGDTPSGLEIIYEIEFVEPIRGDNGRIELYKVIARSRPDLKKTYTPFVNKLSHYSLKPGKCYYVR